MFQGVESGSMPAELKTKHISSEEARQQNKSSHGNEVKCIPRAATQSFCFFYLFQTTRQTVNLPPKRTQIAVIPSSTKIILKSEQFCHEKVVFQFETV